MVILKDFPDARFFAIVKLFYYYYPMPASGKFIIALGPDLQKIFYDLLKDYLTFVVMSTSDIWVVISLRNILS